MSFPSIELYITNRTRKQALCENKLFRNIIPYFPHLHFNCYTFIFATFFSFAKNIFTKEQICDVLQCHPIFSSYVTLSVTFNMGI